MFGKCVASDLSGSANRRDVLGWVFHFICILCSYQRSENYVGRNTSVPRSGPCTVKRTHSFYDHKENDLVVSLSKGAQDFIYVSSFCSFGLSWALSWDSLQNIDSLFVSASRTIWASFSEKTDFICDGGFGNKVSWHVCWLPSHLQILKYVSINITWRRLACYAKTLEYILGNFHNR